MAEAHRDLAAFLAAPESVRAAFWRGLGAEVAAERDDERWLADLHDGDQLARPYRAPHVTVTQWNASWDRRARAVRKARLAPESDWTPSRDEDPLVDIPAAVYVEALTGQDVPASGSMRCPLPDHEDHNPSFRVYAGAGWRCFGCGRSGTIYDLAAALWDITPRGSGFREIHRRLRAVFA